MPFNKVCLGTFYFFVSLNILCLIPHAVGAQNGWRMERFNPARANVTPAKGPQTQAQFSILASDVTERLWRISDGGDLVFTANDTVSCYSASGQLKWRKSIGGTVFDVAIGSDGTVYASSANSVIALNKDNGSPVWLNPVAANNGNESSPMAIGPDGTIYFLSGAGLVGYDPPNVTAINPNGTIKFKTTADFGWGRGNTGLTMNNDASIMYIWGYPTSLISLSGTTGNQITSSNSCRFHGVFQFTPFNSGYSFDGDSQLIEFGQSLSTCSPVPIGNSLLGVVAVAPSNNIILQLYTGSLTKEPLAAVDRQGQRIWTSTERYSSGIIIGNSSPFMDGDGTIFCIAPETNDVVAIDSDSGSVMWRSHFNDPISRLLMSGNGTLYVVAGNNLYQSTATPAVTQRPLIFVPGIAGSRLEHSSCPIDPCWPPTGVQGLANLPALSLDDAGNGLQMDATDIIRTMDVYDGLMNRLTSTATDGGKYIEYRVGNRAGNPCVDAPNPSANLYVFPYDWRKSITQSATSLNAFITCVINDHPSAGGRVDVLTHSMGGLVAARYLADHSTNHRVEHLVTIAAPWLGAPKAIDMLETGSFVDGFWKRLFTNEIFKNLSRNYTAVHQLMPSRRYFVDLGGRPLIRRRLIGPLVIEDYDEFVRIMDERFPGSRPGTTNKTFHDNPPQDDGSRLPSGIKYYHFYGVGPTKDTVSAITIEPNCITLGTIAGPVTIRCYTQYQRTVGDGTVPEISARRIPALNASSASVCPFTDDNNPVVINHIKLSHHYSVLSSAFLAFGSNSQISCNGLGTAQGQSLEAETASAAYYLTLIGAESVKVSDPAGNNTEALSDPSDAGVPNVTTFKTGDTAADLVIPITQTYAVTFRPAGPMYLQVTRETVLPDQAIRYQDLTLPAGVTARIRLTPQGIENLTYDADGDGNFESSVAPTTSVTGTAAQDTEPPVLTISENIQTQNVTLVTLAATDSGSGVKKINYSLDGANYQTYSAPFSVDPYRVRKIYAFADDNVANRSGVVEFQLNAPSLIVFLEQETTNRAVALNSVTWLRSPFPILNYLNFSADRHTRVILFISGPLLTQSDASIVTVQAAGFTLPVENVGTVMGVTGLNASYIIVRLPDGLPAGELPLTIAVGGVVNSNPVTLGISP